MILHIHQQTRTQDISHRVVAVVRDAKGGGVILCGKVRESNKIVVLPCKQIAVDHVWRTNADPFSIGLVIQGTSASAHGDSAREAQQPCPVACTISLRRRWRYQFFYLFI